MIRTLLLALLLTALPAQAAQLLEYHTEIYVTTNTFTEHPFVIDGAHAIQVKSVTITLIGAPLTGSQYGYAYLWRDAPHFTWMLPSGTGLQQIWQQSFGADYILLPASTTEQWCLITQFPGGAPAGQVYDISILYLLP